jgi:hypothetical protein
MSKLGQHGRCRLRASTRWAGQAREHSVFLEPLPFVSHLVSPAQDSLCAG